MQNGMKYFHMSFQETDILSFLRVSIARLTLFLFIFFLLVLNLVNILYDSSPDPF